jgi:hypothetical protein
MQSTDMQGTRTSHQMSPDAIIQKWQAMGVTTVEELAVRASELTVAQAAPRRVPLDLDSVLRETPSELARTLTHRPMQHTVIVDGSETSDLQHYNGQPLHYVMSTDTMNGAPVIAYSRLAELKAHIQETLAASDEGLIGTSDPDAFTPTCFFYDDINYQGNVKSLDPGTWYPDLTRVTRNVSWQDWNDAISSLAQSRSLRIAWEHINEQGSAFVFHPGVGGSLVDIGWNDVISSIMNAG